MLSKTAVIENDRLNIAENFYSQARKLYEANDFETSIDIVNKALDIYLEEEIFEMVFECLLLRASNYSGIHEFLKSLEDLSECENHCNKIGLNNGLMRTFNLIGYNYSYINNYEKATQAFENSMKIAKALYDDKFIITLCLNLLTIYIFNKSYEKAVNIIQECHRIFKGSNNKYKYALFLEKISLLYSEIDEIIKSNEINEELLKYYDLENNEYKKGIMLFYIGNNYFKKNEFEIAYKYYKNSLELIEKSGNSYISFEYYLHFGIVLLKLNKFESAKVNFDKFLGFNKDENKEIGIAFDNIAEYYFFVDDFTNSRIYFRKAIDIFLKLEKNDLYIETVIKFLKLYKKELGDDEIFELLNEAMKVCEKSADFGDMIPVCKEYAEIYSRLNNTEKANFYKNKINYLNLLKNKKELQNKSEINLVLKKLNEINLTIL
ncbi:MAG TPA: tetratricopeptide repeat protein [Ignavibacteria bacterium]|nr:tetratricopeptide repeat protein [Ignavibacteria bacterium]